LLARDGTIVGVMIFGHLLAHALGRIRAVQYIYLALFLLMAVGLPVGSVVGLSVIAGRELAKESSFHRRFGEDWKAQYEQMEGPLSTARIKAGVAVLGAVANCLLGIWYYRQLFPALFQGETFGSYSPGRRRHRSRRHR
jgi:hypothetical protein